MKNLFYELQDVKFIKCFWIHLKCVSAFWMFFKMLIPPHLSPNVWDVFVSGKSILQIDLWGAIEHMTEISAFQISDGIRFYILWFWNTHEEKSCHLGLKLEEVCRRPQDGKVEMRGKQKNHWLNENITVCSLRSKQQPWRGGNSQTGRNCPSPCHGQWAGSPPPFPDTSLLLTSCRSFSRSGIFSLCASVPYSHCSLSCSAHLLTGLLHEAYPFFKTKLKHHLPSLVPSLSLQTTLVFSLVAFSRFPLLITGCSLVCYSNEIKIS